MRLLLFLVCLFVCAVLFSQDSIKSESRKEYYTLVDETASYPGGYQALGKYLRDNLKYPTEAIEQGVEGRVFVQFIVETDGTGSDIKVVKGIGSGCDEEALRLIKKMPVWIPAKKDGVLVRQKMIQNILFKLPEG